MRLVLRLTAVLLVLAALPTAAADIAVNVDSQPAGLTIRFDGADAIAPFTRMVPAGTSHSLLAVSPQAGEPGTRFLFDHWNGPFGVPLTSAQFNFTPGGSYFDSAFNLGPSLSWTGGAADCTFSVVHLNGGKIVTDGSTTVHVDA